MWEILTYILASGFIGFTVFLLGYSAFSIAKNGKLKRQKKEAEIRQIENAKLENYMRNIDNDLRQEIDSAVREHNQQSQNTGTTNKDNIPNSEFSNKLSNRIMQLIEKGIVIAEKGLDIASNKVDEKHSKMGAEQKQTEWDNSFNSNMKGSTFQEKIKQYIYTIFQNINQTDKK